jgi:hypothetical protein
MTDKIKDKNLLFHYKYHLLIFSWIIYFLTMAFKDSFKLKLLYASLWYTKNNCIIDKINKNYILT